MDAGRIRKLVIIVVFLFLLVVVGGGVVAGLPLLLFPRSPAYDRQSRDMIMVNDLPHEMAEPDVIVHQPVMHEMGSVDSFAPISDACRPDDMPYVGITYLPVTEATARYYGLASADGLLITAIAPNSPAARAGLRRDDVLLGFNDHSLGRESSMVAILMSHQVGDNVSLAIMRQNERKVVRMILGIRPGN